MTLNSKSLAVIILVVLFGGILFTTAMGWWQTTNTKVAATFTEGEFAGQANPADIRGSYTFGDVEKNFGIPAATLAQAFVVEGDPAAYPVKNLEATYGELETEIGTASVRLFVALYLGLPYDLSADTYLPEPAAELLKGRTLTPEQVSYLEAHTVSLPAAGTDAPQPASTPQAESTPVADPAQTTTSANLVKGKTTFGEILSWGVPQAAIEQVIGGPLPAPSVTAKDYCTQSGLDFETIKVALQAEVDKVK